MADLNYIRGQKAPIPITSLTDSTTGAVSNTLQSHADTTGALLTNLITDLNGNTIPGVRNNNAVLAAKINEIIAILRAYGLAQ